MQRRSKRDSDEDGAAESSGATIRCNSFRISEKKIVQPRMVQLAVPQSHNADNAPARSAVDSANEPSRRSERV